MTYKTRTILAVILVEGVLAGIWFYLASMGQAQPDRVAPEFQATLGSTMGMVMGGLLGFGVLLFFLAAKRDRQG
jgi:hypothetical protein